MSKFTNSPLVVHTRISPNKTSPRNQAIDRISIHCVAGNLTIESLGALFAPDTRQASSNYGIGSDGRVGMYVEEKDRSWCTSSSANDHRAITIEVSNTQAAHPWPCSDAAMATLIKLCADICSRNNIKELVWINNKDKPGNMTIHRWFAAKACPGDFLVERHGMIASEVNKLLGGTVSTPAPKPETDSKGRITITQGMKGDPVKEAQKLLNKHGANPKLDEDNSFGPLTANANEAFQKKVGISPVDKTKIGPNVWTELDKDPVSATPITPPANTSGLTPICRKATVNATQMRAYIRSRNATVANSVLEMIPFYISEGEVEGIDGGMAFAQSCLETGNFGFAGSAVTLDQNNFCGMAVTQNGMKGNSYKTPQEGIRAQIQHLKAYANKEALKGTLVTPTVGQSRFNLVTRGCAEFVEWLGQQENPQGRGWATGADYGKKILDILKVIESLPKEEAAPAPTPAPTPAPAPAPSTPQPIKLGDIVNFIGTKHFTSANATGNGSTCKPGRATVDKISSGKYPYHLIKVSGGGSTVHGWVAAKDIEGASTSIPSTPTPTPPSNEPIKVGDIVEFKGKYQYLSANSTSPISAKSGKAKVTNIYHGKHPYHIVAVTPPGVYGWVDASDVTK